jgi:hypothetical protein
VERPAIGLGRSLARRIPDPAAPTRLRTVGLDDTGRPARAGDSLAA